MSEPTTPPAPAPADPAPNPEPQDVKSLPPWAQALVGDLRKEAAGHRTKVRELEPLAAEAQKLKDAGRSDAEKLAAATAAAEQRAAAAEANAMRLDVAFAKGLTQAQAKRLVGSTREELEADADEILRDFPTAPAAPEKPKPVGDIGQGPRPAPDAPRPTTAKDLIAAGLTANQQARKGQ